MSLNVNKRAKPKLKLSKLDLKKYLTLKIHLSDITLKMHLKELNLKIHLNDLS